MRKKLGLCGWPTRNLSSCFGGHCQPKRCRLRQCGRSRPEPPSGNLESSACQGSETSGPPGSWANKWKFCGPTKIPEVKTKAKRGVCLEKAHSPLRSGRNVAAKGRRKRPETLEGRSGWGMGGVQTGKCHHHHNRPHRRPQAGDPDAKRKRSKRRRAAS